MLLRGSNPANQYFPTRHPAIMRGMNGEITGGRLTPSTMTPCRKMTMKTIMIYSASIV